MVQELHTQDIVHVEKINELTPEQEDMLWWEYYEKNNYEVFLINSFKMILITFANSMFSISSTVTYLNS
jgi:hypothetical protein